MLYYFVQIVLIQPALYKLILKEISFTEFTHVGGLCHYFWSSGWYLCATTVKSHLAPALTPDGKFLIDMDEYYASEHEWIEEERPKSRCRSARTPRTPRTPRALSPRRKVYGLEEDVVQRNNERNRRTSRPASARDPPRSACSRRSSLTKRPAFTIY